MFYCDDCRVKHGWPESLSVSAGKCEVCGKRGVCYDLSLSSGGSSTPSVSSCPSSVPPNPYQSPLPDGFLDDTVQGYEESIRTHERTITELRDRIAALEAENERLKWQLVGSPILAGGFLEGADID